MSETENQSPESSPEAYFIQQGDLFVPTKRSLGYWLDNTLTGPAVASLLACCLEREFGGPDYIVTRYCVDLLGMIRAEPFSVETRMLRSGKRLQLAEASISANGQLLARASAQFIRKTENPDNPTWQTPAWRSPLPDELEPGKGYGLAAVKPVAAEHARIDRVAPDATDSGRGNAPVLGPMAPVACRQAWFQPQRLAIAGVPLTPFMRAAMMGDMTSPMTHSSEFGIDFINTDFTLYLHREPVGEWIGLELVSHNARDGVGIGGCWMHDVEGVLGTVNLSAIAQIRRKNAA